MEISDNFKIFSTSLTYPDGCNNSVKIH